MRILRMVFEAALFVLFLSSTGSGNHSRFFSLDAPDLNEI